jgi:hypothetical protein
LLEILGDNQHTSWSGRYLEWRGTKVAGKTSQLTPKGPRAFLGPFLKFGQTIVNAIFVQKISNFW